MCITYWDYIPIDDISDMSCRIIKYLQNKQCVLPNLHKSSTLISDIGILDDEWNLTVRHIPLYLLFGEDLYKLIGYKEDLNNDEYIRECDGLIIIDHKATKDNPALTYKYITPYLLQDNKLVKIKPVICKDHLIYPYSIDSNIVLNLFICAYTSWTTMTDKEYQLVTDLLPNTDCSSLYNKKYDKILWDEMNLTHSMPFILIPRNKNYPFRLKFQMYPSIDKKIYHKLFKFVFNKLLIFIIDSINNFNYNEVNELIHPKEISEIVKDKKSFSQILLNSFALLQGFDFALDTLYYPNIIFNDEAKLKLISIIKKDFSLLNKAIDDWI